ncbi:hypothetical protein AGMMS50284_5490 [Clostridia bacterium]|nr:hypothetical protein AGMMS50284_5490 [Clostridia bacterium]
MKFKKILAAAMAALMVVSVATVSASAAADINSSNKYEKQAAEYDLKAYSGNDLGAIYSPTGTTFKVWSPSASAVSLNLYKTGSDKETGAEKIGTYPLTQDTANAVWSYTASGDLLNTYYTYSVKNDGKTEEVVDIYAKAVGVEGNRGMVVDLSKTDPSDWAEDTNFTRVANQTDAKVWEVHVKDFSVDPSSGVSEANRGKYLAFTENDTTLNGEGKVKTGTSYLKDLGVNYIHINPFYDFGSILEAGSDAQFNWGYDPKNYNAPEGSYSSNPYDGNVRINETKQMVKGLHDQGLGVIMDVVYNHTYSFDSWFQKTVPNYYYRLNADGSKSTGSGCGNDTASEREMYRKYMIDSVVYWATEYHLDGFRFDLMGLHDVETMNAIRTALDAIDPKIVVYGEGWIQGTTFDTGAIGANQSNSAKISTRIGFFNDQLRDAIKGSVFDEKGKAFIQGVNSATTTNSIAKGLLANTTGGNWTSQQPSQTVSYASCHDNATLYDRIVASLGGKYDVRNDNYIQRNKLSAALVFSSQGTTFLLAGEEFARSKQGDHNSYSSPVSINRIDWADTVRYADLVSYYKGLISIRDYYSPLRTPTKTTDATTYVNENGTIALSYNTPTATWKNVLFLFNNANTEQDVAVAATATAASNWVIIANDKSAGTAKLGEVSGTGTYKVPANSALILVDKESYTASGITSNLGTVKVQHINKATNAVLSEYILTGTVGSAYQTKESNQFDLYYNLESVVGDESGTFAATEKVVKYYYEENLLVPKDVTGDGKVDMSDVVALQKHIAKLITITGQFFINGDVDRNEKIDLVDVVLTQKYIAKFKSPSGIGTVTVNYYDADGKKLQTSKVETQKIGSSYTVEPANIPMYALDTTKLPTNETGKIQQLNTDVNYYYVTSAATATIRVKVPDGETWVPNLYAWDDSTSPEIRLLGNWPGKEMIPTGTNNEYEITLPYAQGGKFNWIVNSNGGQTADQKDFSGDLYIVMKSATIVDSVTPLVK